MGDRSDVVVVGAGMAGAATAYWLALNGRSVTLLERFDLGNKSGSSHGASRIFRLSYDEEHYVADCVASLALWREVESHTGATLLTTTGGLDVGPGALDNQRALTASGVESTLLDTADARRRFPLLGFPDDQPVLFQEDAGVAHAEASVRRSSREP